LANSPSLYPYLVDGLEATLWAYLDEDDEYTKSLKASEKAINDGIAKSRSERGITREVRKSGEMELARRKFRALMLVAKRAGLLPSSSLTADLG
jgi:hypothetical protein